MAIPLVYLIETGSKTNKQVVIVGLISLKGRLVANGLAAFVAAVNYDKALFRVGKSLNGTENSFAFVSPVARVYINVKRAKTKGTVIS